MPAKWKEPAVGKTGIPVLMILFPLADFQVYKIETPTFYICLDFFIPFLPHMNRLPFTTPQHCWDPSHIATSYSKSH